MGKNVIISTVPNVTQNYLSKLSTGNIFVDSLVYDNGTSVMINTATAHADYASARLIVNNTGNAYLEVRGNGGQGTLVLTTSTSTTGTYPTVEIFNSGNFGIVAYRPGTVSSNYLMYYDLGSSTNRALTFQTEGVDRLKIQQAGRILMGPTLPTDDGSTALQVNGGGKFSNTVEIFDNTNSGILRLSRDAGGQRGALIFGRNNGGTFQTTGQIVCDSDTASVNNGVMSFWTSNSSGVNTQRLTISGTGAATFSANSTTVELNTSTRALKITGKDNYYPIECSGGTTTSQSYGPYFKAGTSASDQSLVVDNGAGTVNYFTIRGDGYTYFKGNVGIGTTSPSGVLHVIKDGAGNANTNITGSQLILSRTTGATENIAFRNTGTSAGISGLTYAGQIISDGNNGFEIFTDGSVPVMIGTSATERMRITSGGNVGIGTSSNLSAALTTNGGISIGNGWGTSGATLEMSTDNVGSGGAAIVVSYWGSSSYGPLVFNVGNAERMRITSGGAPKFTSDVFYNNSDKKKTIFGNTTIAGTPTPTVFTINVTFASACYATVMFRAGGTAFGGRFNALSIYGIDTTTTAQTNNIVSGGYVTLAATRVSDTSWNFTITNNNSSTTANVVYELQVNASVAITN